MAGLQQHQVRRDAVAATCATHTCPDGFVQRAGVEELTAPTNSLCCCVTILGSCYQEGDCIMSPGYPGFYGKGQKCEFHMAGNINIMDFETEAEYDYLLIGDIFYSGTSDDYWKLARGQTVSVNGVVAWSSDSDVEAKGWKICVEPTNAPAAGGTCADPDPNNAGDVGYVCPVGYVGAFSNQTPDCTNITSCNEHCCDKMTCKNFNEDTSFRYCTRKDHSDDVQVFDRYSFLASCCDVIPNNSCMFSNDWECPQRENRAAHKGKIAQPTKGK